MDPNQQPNPTPVSPVPPQPQPAPQPAPQPGYSSAPQPAQPAAQPYAAPQPVPQSQSPYAAPQQTVPPQTPSSYAPTAQPNYDPNYLDSIAPAPPAPKFFSGSFGKIFFGMIGLFVLAVSLIIAFSGKDKTADLQQIVVRLENMSKTAKTVQKNIKSSNLSNINTTYSVWLTGTGSTGESLLKEGGVKKTDYNKEMVANEKSLAADLDAKFEDARLNATLNRVYSNTMSSETEKLLNLLNAMAKKSQSSKIRDYAKNAAKTLETINKDFNDYNDDGN